MGPKETKVRVIGSTVAILIIICAVAIFFKNHAHNQPTSTTHYSGCVAQQLTVGSNGSCVNDVQTMIDFMESDGLTECRFTGGALLPINGTYDSATAAQVQVIEKWENCYNKQEGSDVTIGTSGTVTTSTWSEVCTYAYHYPAQASSGPSSYRAASLTAGKNAGCAELFQ
jgi:hypothetical protein